MYKCPFCGGTYKLVSPPTSESLICYIPNCNKTGDKRFPTQVLMGQSYICDNCNNIQLFAIKK